MDYNGTYKLKGNNSIVILDIDKNVTIKISKSAISGSQSIDEKKN